MGSQSRLTPVTHENSEALKQNVINAMAAQSLRTLGLAYRYANATVTVTLLLPVLPVILRAAC